MEIKLNHNFINKAYDLNALLKDVNKLSTFCNRLEKQSLLYPDRYDPEKYKGDGFELLVEALIKLSPIDNRIGISEYEPIQKDDIGIDGMGIGIDGYVTTVQIKYRTDNTQQLTANKDHLSNFTSASKDIFLSEAKNDNSILNHIDNKNRMLIVTTAEGLHHFTDNEMFANKVNVIGYKHLRQLLDNNINFWNTFRLLLNIK